MAEHSGNVFRNIAAIVEMDSRAARTQRVTGSATRSTGRSAASLRISTSLFSMAANHHRGLAAAVCSTRSRSVCCRCSCRRGWSAVFV